MDFTNSTLNLKHLAWVLLLLFFSCAQAEEYVPGRHYEILDNPTITRNPSKVEVVEVFWFGCNHCYSLESYIQPWKRNLPNDVDFWKSHITWNAQAETHARLFYSAKPLELKKKLFLQLLQLYGEKVEIFLVILRLNTSLRALE